MQSELMRVLLSHERVVLFHGLASALDIGEHTVDALVFDPPAGIGFMDRGWDKAHGGRDAWIAWFEEQIAPSVRALKPGGYGFVWALPRTSHWTATALENAGLEIRDIVDHIFGTGFPKSLNVSKALDTLASAEREVVGRKKGAGSDDTFSLGSFAFEYDETTPATELARRFDGFGTALKPAHEHWILVRKPMKGTVAANLAEHGTGAINIDGCRVATADTWGPTTRAANESIGTFKTGKRTTQQHTNGRWPANVVLSHHDDCDAIHAYDGPLNGPPMPCSSFCPVRVLDEQSGTNPNHKGKPRQSTQSGGVGFGMMKSGAEYSDSGGASRFFYVAKPSTSERELGLEHLAPSSGGKATGRRDGSKGLGNPRAGAGRKGGRRNIHPTVKSQGLMRWLVRLVCPPGGVVLDPFTGSGSTGVAALAEGMYFVGVELGGDDGEYLPILEGRIRHALTATTPAKVAR